MAPTVEDTVREIVGRSNRPVVAAYLFGSEARGAATSASDIDVAVLCDEIATARLTEPIEALRVDLERALRRPVDLLVLNSAPPDLVHRVLRDGRVVTDRDRSARIRFEVRSRNEYFDLLPILREYRRPRTDAR